MLFSILNFFFSAIIIILFVRYFVEKYRFYGFGPIMVAIVTLTERMIVPLKRILPRWAHHLEEHLPLAAIAVVLLIRGVFIWALGAGPLDIMARFHGTSGGAFIFYAIAISFSMGVLLMAELLIAFLFASLMVSRRGITLGGNAGFMCFQERTFSVFRWMQKFIKSDNLLILFIGSFFIITISGALLASLISLTFLYGPTAFGVTFITCLFTITLTLIQIYWMVLLLSILASWIGADQFSLVVQIVRAIADPYLEFFRRLMPWARIDFIDLSPIFAFLCLNPGVTYLLMSLQAIILHKMLSPFFLM